MYSSIIKRLKLKKETFYRRQKNRKHLLTKKSTNRKRKLKMPVKIEKKLIFL